MTSDELAKQIAMKCAERITWRNPIGIRDMILADIPLVELLEVSRTAQQCVAKVCSVVSDEEIKMDDALCELRKKLPELYL